MAKPKRPPEQKKNGFEDSDFRDILNEIEGYVDQQVSIRAKAAGECGGLAKKIKNAKATAKALGIPLSVLGASLKTRKLERQMKKIADEIPEDLVEVWLDAAGQFSFFAPAVGDAEEAAPASAAASQRVDEAKAHHEAEQAEGAAVLDELAGAVR